MDKVRLELGVALTWGDVGDTAKQCVALLDSIDYLYEQKGRGWRSPDRSERECDIRQAIQAAIVCLCCQNYDGCRTEIDRALRLIGED